MSLLAACRVNVAFQTRVTRESHKDGLEFGSYISELTQANVSFGCDANCLWDTFEYPNWFLRISDLFVCHH